MRRVRFVHLLWCIALLGVRVPVLAADAPTATTPEGLTLLEGWASSWTWHEGLHYGVDVPDAPATWEAGDLRWRPLLRGNLGIRLAIDAIGVVEHGELADADDDVGVRRAYIYADGTIAGFWKPLSYKFELGAVNDSFSLRNASIAIHEIPYAGTFRMGAYDAPMSISMLASSRATPLMELPLAVQALVPGTLAGLGFKNHVAPYRLTWAFGVFSEADDADVGDRSDAAFRAVGRLVWLPWRRPADLLHVGLSLSLAGASDGIRYSSRPESFFAPNVVDTGAIPADNAIVVDVESVWVRNRLSLQGEYLRAFVFGDGASNPTFEGTYFTVSWFLTPDTRNYDDAATTFGALVPAHPVSWAARQIGAVEVAARISLLDLTDQDVRGGRALELMSGLNWYLNRYVRLQFNVGYVHASGGPRPGDAAVLQTRFDLLI